MEHLKFKYKNDLSIIPITGEPVAARYEGGSKSVVVTIGDKSVTIASEIDDADQAMVVCERFMDEYSKLAEKDVVVSNVKEIQIEKEYYSTWKVLVVCIGIIALAVYLYSSKHPYVKSDIKEVYQQPHSANPQQLEITQDFAQEILELDLDPKRREQLAEGKEKMLKILANLKTMSKEEQMEYIQTEEVQELINTPWAKGLLE